MSRGITKEEILSGASPGLFWTMEDENATIKDTSMLRGTSMSDLCAGQCLGLVATVNDEITPSRFTFIGTLDNAKAHKSSSLRVSREDILAGKSPGLFWSMCDVDKPSNPTLPSNQTESDQVERSQPDREIIPNSLV